MQHSTNIRLKAGKSPMILFLSALTLLSIVIACWKIDQPGLYYDEMLFGNAAVGGKTDNFVMLRIGNIPFLLMNYIGALKAWIYYPIFSIFPVNYWSVRLPSILLGTMGGLFLVAALYRGFGRSAAIAGAVMILLDPTMITHSRLDWGPNALMFFFRGLLIFALVMWIRTKEPKWAWLAFGAGVLGIFDKLNFIWMVLSAIAALTLLYRKECLEFARNYKKQALLLSILTISGLIFSVIRGIRLSEHQEIDWPHRISQAFDLLRLTFSGGGALNFISGNGLRLERWFWPGYILAALIGLTGYRSLFRQAQEKCLYLWMLLLFGMVTVAFILTKSATGPHHSSMVSGIWQLALAPLSGAAWDDRSSGWHRLRRWGVPASLIAISAGCIISCFICIRAFASPINNNWDPANTAAALFARQHPEGVFISCDWGIGTLIIALTKDKPVINDAWPAFTSSGDAGNLIKHLPEGKDVYFYTRLPGFENFKGNHDRLIQALAGNGLDYEVIRTYKNLEGQPMIEIGCAKAHKTSFQ